MYLAVAAYTNSTTANTQTSTSGNRSVRESDVHRGRRFAVPKPGQDVVSSNNEALLATAGALYDSWKQRQVDWEVYVCE